MTTLQTWYTLREDAHKQFNEMVSYKVEREKYEVEELTAEKLDEDIHILVDQLIPIYTADSLNIAIHNLSLATRDDEYSYPEEANAIDIINVNIYYEMITYLLSSADCWLDELIDIRLARKAG